MSKDRTIRFRDIDRTEDTGDPVIQLFIPATESQVTAILDREEKTIRVWRIDSEETGDMKRLLDALVKKLGWRDMMFLCPLDEFKAFHQTTLEERLHGFETTVQTIQKPDGTTEEQKRYVGKWDV